MIRVLVVDDDFMVAKVHSGYVDRTPNFTVFGSRRPGTAPLPKGLTEQTAELVKAALTDHPEGLSAMECAHATSLSRPSARRYLEHFVETGRAEVRLRYGNTGRPERQYHWRG
ncbi:helix-turn-helix domain-containing protein [Saccharomonospora glauca]|uniref:Response regulator of citrate/malate metabolism n=1 Tax=Saccharomonospora glauca K62 TaxID=928724 RepID=I1D7U7_9PSEU|nr:helix-turn-helix domain-containing protein [Saccharomonospora glauca]EIF01022.1 response regulator of citrate/malate metabolism [Saccharomonospora glauca K62]